MHHEHHQRDRLRHARRRALGDQLVTSRSTASQSRVPAGTSLMRAAVDAGINVPKLCATDSLEPFGSCRLCLVEIEGRQGLSGLLHHAVPNPA